jgi:polysaccharide export outer membrane protein
VEHVINPQVNVEVASYRNRKYYILGEVRKPGVFVIEDSVRVIEAIAMAGGFTWDARTNNVILVRQAPDHLELRSLNIDALLGKGELEQNVFLQRGDVVYVTPTTIVDIERFMKRFYTIILPLVEVERGIIFGYEVSDLIEGEATRVILPISR